MVNINAHFEQNNIQPFKELSNAISFHNTVIDYSVSPIKHIRKNIYIKDESHRFHLNSFKSLGVSYAIFEFLSMECNSIASFSDIDRYIESKKFHFCTVSDGNFGLAFSWFCSKIRQQCTIYLPVSTPKIYSKIIKKHGGNVVLCNNYKDCMYMAIKDSKKNNYQMILDTFIPKNESRDLSYYVAFGYSTIWSEVKKQGLCFDNIIVPIGSGGLAYSAVMSDLRNAYGKRSKIYTVESEVNPKFFKSLINNKIIEISSENSIANGLNCNNISLSFWEILKNNIYGTITVSEKQCRKSNDYMNKKLEIDSGYTGSISYAGLQQLLKNEKMNKNETFLIINTEGKLY